MHCPVEQIKALPVDELNGWFAFYEEKSRRDRAGKGDLAAMIDAEDPDEIAGNLKSLGIID